MNQLNIDSGIRNELSTVLLVIAFILFSFSSYCVFAQQVNFQVQADKKTSPMGGANFNFGYAVAIDSSTLMVGAPGYDSSKGRVYVYSKNAYGWQLTQTLSDAQAIANEYFGSAIDINGNLAVIGGYGRSVVLIFEKVDGFWNYRQTINQFSGYGGFGTSLDLSDNFLIIGFPTGIPAVGGSAYLYKKMEGMWIHRDIFYGDLYFGKSVCYNPDTEPLFLIGDVFHRKVVGKYWNNTTISEFTLSPSDTSESDSFGECVVSPNPSTIIISDPSRGRNSYIRCGAVYVFRKSGQNWAESQIIQPPILGYNLNFGSSICAYGDFLVIGATLENKLYIYKKVGNAYNFVKTITAEDSESGDNFGAAVSCFENNFVVGTPNDKIGLNEGQGSVYIYSPCILGSAYNFDFLASVTHSGSFSLNTFLMIDPGSIGSNYSLLSLKGWTINSQDGFTFQDGMVGANLDSVSTLKNYSFHPCWLKRTNEVSPWEYIGGKVEGNYVYSTVPFNSLSQFILVDSVDTATSISDNSIVPDKFVLYQNYPNPFNPSTKIRWQSPSSSHQALKVYDVLGNEVATLVDEYKPAGRYEVDFELSSSIRNLSSGIYMYQLRAGEFVQTKKMILIR